MAHNLHKTLKEFDSGSGKGKFYSLPQLGKALNIKIDRLPVSIRIVLESVLRNYDGKKIAEEHIEQLANWKPTAARVDEIPFVVSRVVLQDFTGVPLLADIAAMRGVAKHMGKDPKSIEPLVPVDLVVDHSVQIDHFREKNALDLNMKLEFQRNNERYQFMKWGMQAFDRVEDIKKITIRTHEAALRIIDKKGPLNNPADRDHCIQYMIAVPLIHGRLTAADYEDSIAQDARIDVLRAKMECVEDAQFTKDYHDPEKRSIANALTIEFNDGSTFDEVVVEYPIGHKRRREDGIPLLVEKFKTNLARRFPVRQQLAILDVSLDQARLEAMPVNEYVDLYVI